MEQIKLIQCHLSSYAFKYLLFLKSSTPNLVDYFYIPKVYNECCISKITLINYYSHQHIYIKQP